MRDPIVFHRYASLTALAAFCLLIAGGLVTSNDAGLAVPDWPLSYGTWFPPMVGGIRYEHSHRVIAGAVGLMILALAVWLGRAEPRRWVRRLGAIALCAVIVQALLGGLTVLLLLPPPVSIAHACLGQAVFSLLVCLGRATAPGWPAHPAAVEDRSRPSIAALALAAAGLVSLQLVLGAVIRHTGHAVIAHLAGAVAVVVAVAWLAARVRGLGPVDPQLRGDVRRLAALVAVQLIVGAAVFTHRGSAALRTAHVALGALVLAQAVMAAWEVARRVPPESASARRNWRRHLMARLADCLELTKPRLSGLVLVTTSAGWWLGVRAPGELGRLVPVALGTALVVGGANALNQWMEREPDARMERTRHRPVPSGRLAPETAFRFGLGCSAAGLALLATAVNSLSACLAAAAWTIYLGVYTPLKRWTPLCTLVGAVAGAVPPLIGWAGARGALAAEAWVLFAILFIWQLPHFLALAVLYRDDYARAGFPMLPLVEPGGALAAARQTALYGAALLPVSLFPTLLGVAGTAYFYGAAALGVAFGLVSAQAAWRRSLPSARHLFRASVIYLPALLGLLAWDRSPR